jgi:hypothetical protein
MLSLIVKQLTIALHYTFKATPRRSVAGVAHKESLKCNVSEQGRKTVSDEWLKLFQGNVIKEYLHIPGLVDAVPLVFNLAGPEIEWRISRRYSD